MGDPIAKQAAIVTAMTQGKVVWTPAHRDALRAINEGQSSGPADPGVLADIKLLLEVLMLGLKDRGEKAS